MPTFPDHSPPPLRGSGINILSAALMSINLTRTTQLKCLRHQVRCLIVRYFLAGDGVINAAERKLVPPHSPGARNDRTGRELRQDHAPRQPIAPRRRSGANPVVGGIRTSIIDGSKGVTETCGVSIKRPIASRPYDSHGLDARVLEMAADGLIFRDPPRTTSRWASGNPSRQGQDVLAGVFAGDATGQRLHVSRVLGIC
jgi:hypothetical protein